MTAFYKNMKEGRDGDSTKTDLETVNRARRIGHSLRDYIKTILPERKEEVGRTMMKGIDGPKSHLTRGGQFYDGAANVVGGGLATLGAGVGAGAIAGVGVIAGGVTLAAIVTFLTVGIAPLVIAIAGLVIVFVKSAYSDRDGAHMALQNHLWSLVDKDPPTAIASADELYALSGAALTLLTDGKNQIARLGPKLKYASEDLQKLNDSLVRKADRIKKAANWKAADKDRKAMKTQIQDAKKRDGAIYNFTRRAVHTGNYIQAPEIIGLAMKYNFSPSGTMPKLGQDPFLAGTGLKMRALFQRLEEFYTSLEAIVAVDDETRFGEAKANAAAAMGKGAATNLGASRAYKR